MVTKSGNDVFGRTRYLPDGIRSALIELSNSPDACPAVLLIKPKYMLATSIDSSPQRAHTASPAASPEQTGLLERQNQASSTAPASNGERSMSVGSSHTAEQLQSDQEQTRAELDNPRAQPMTRRSRGHQRNNALTEQELFGLLPPEQQSMLTYRVMLHELLPGFPLRFTRTSVSTFSIP